MSITLNTKTDYCTEMWRVNDQLHLMKEFSDCKYKFRKV